MTSSYSSEPSTEHGIVRWHGAGGQNFFESEDSNDVTTRADDFDEAEQPSEELPNIRNRGPISLPPHENDDVLGPLLGGYGSINTSLRSPYRTLQTTRRFFRSRTRLALCAILMFSVTVWALIVFAVLSSRAAGEPPTSSPPSVTLDYGTFIGLEDNSTGVTSFKGIRFADAPVGNLRWREPVSPPSQHLGTVNATKFASSCVSFAQSGSEDCLFGNVFAPAGTTSRDRLPVLVWFHGGGFQSSSTRHADPVWLLQSTAKPFIFVSFAYRLGDMGFMAGSRIAQDGDLNVGLLDQRAGLRWVQRYIREFGGDRSRVTIWGQSAGAGSTMYHLIANGGNNEGLFHAAMGDSPCNTFTPSATGDYLETLFSQYATYAGCDPDTPDALGCLRNADISVLQSAGTQLANNRTSTLFNFAPILGGYVTQRPVEAFSSGRFARVPVFFGSNTDEGAHWSAGLPNPGANTSEPDATEQTAYNFLQGQWDTLSKQSFNRVLRLYPLEAFDKSISLQGQQMYGDMRYICTAGMITGTLTRAGLPAFRYHYDNKHLGAFHHYDLQAMFPDEVPDFPPDASDTALFQAMREYWTSFVTDGRPSSKSAGVPWSSVRDTSSGSPRLLLSPGTVQMEDIDHDSATRCTLWKSLSNEMQT